MTFHELKNQLKVDTPLGRGTAILLESVDNDHYYTVIIHDSLALVTFSQHQLKVVRNYSLGWGFDDEAMKAIIKKK